MGKKAVRKLKAAPQHIRIIAGRWRGTKLPVLCKNGVRPTSNRIREALFNWLQASIQGSRCLDLFAGSGALGFEAVSRGAAQAVLVDNDSEVIKLLEQQVARLQTRDIQLICSDSLRFIKQAQTQYDYIFLDPPFSKYELKSVLAEVINANILKDHGLIYMEAPLGQFPDLLPLQWQWQRQSKAGEVEYGLITSG